MAVCATGASNSRWALGRGVVNQRLFYQDWAGLAATGLPGNVTAYGAARHVEVTSGTDAGLLQKALAEQAITRPMALALPGFLGLTIGACPCPVDGCAVCHPWHERAGHDPKHVWLRQAVRICLTFDGVAGGSPGGD